MTRWLHSGDPEWTELFTSYQRSAFRLECQQIYASEDQDASVAQFLSGQPVQVKVSKTTARTRAQLAKGRPKVRVRVVVEPITQYTRWELFIYPWLIAGGEDIRIIAVQQGDWPEGLPQHDYWLFDDERAWRMHYHENFHWKGAELIDDPRAVAEYRRAREQAEAVAVPYTEFMASRPYESENVAARSPG